MSGSQQGGGRPQQGGDPQSKPQGSQGAQQHGSGSTQGSQQGGQQSSQQGGGRPQQGGDPQSKPDQSGSHSSQQGGKPQGGKPQGSSQGRFYWTEAPMLDVNKPPLNKLNVISTFAPLIEPAEPKIQISSNLDKPSISSSLEPPYESIKSEIQTSNERDIFGGFELKLTEPIYPEIHTSLNEPGISSNLKPPIESNKPEIQATPNERNIFDTFKPLTKQIQSINNQSQSIFRSSEPSNESFTPNTQPNEQIPTFDGMPNENLNGPTFDPLIAISKWPYYVLPFPIDQLPTDIQKAIHAIQIQIENHLNNNTNNQTQGSGQQSSSSSQGQGQQGQGQDPSSQGMIGYIPIVFFPCNGGGQGQMAMPYPYQQPQQQQQTQQSSCGQCQGSNAAQRSHPLFGAISNARIFHNSDFNSVTQVLPRPVRSRKAKIDRKIVGASVQN